MEAAPTPDRTVLIVDDHPSFPTAARFLLETEGFDIVGVAADGESAVREALRLSPEIVLLDVSLPDMDGFEVASRLRAAGTSSIIVFTSSRDRSDFGSLIIDSGGSGFVAKAELSGEGLHALVAEIGRRYPRSFVTELVVATPVFLDLTFIGMEALPALGEERFAAELLRSPGGGAITAVGAARLGLSTAVAAPIGDDVAGELVGAALAEERVDMIATRPAPRTPTTVVLPFGGDRAMITVDPGVRASAADVSAGAPRAVATNLDMLHLVPPGAMAYVTCGDDEARAFKGRPPAALAGSRALFVNRAEALALTGEETVEQAATALATLAESVVVSLAADGGLLATAGEILTVPAERVDAPVDTTGAGDLLTAAYIWADLRGAEAIDRLRWAILYASLAVTTPTGIGGALTEVDLVAAGTARGLQPPPRVEVARS